VLVVSHDRYFVNEIADRIWEIEDLEVKDYKGNYEFYQEERKKQAELLAEREAELEKQRACAEQQAKKNAPQAVPEKVEAKNKQRRYSPDEAKKLLPKVELSIREQEAMMKLLEMKMADPANHADPAQSAAMAAEHDEYEAKIMELMEKWEQLMEASEE
jgi:ATP-binding cassette subfamily F protein 3